ncbi:hypothetical protein [Rhodococcoides kyotonense]|uniref:WXG100 family type VII secretion target n=1 Tax=Rhodococcoides kyotonense TaxID=398843 RepID=A0A239LE14_9NOCA|nr:hypothetical protein [Rhodococcus kyotonensis]SNT27774.1 hypothetical protein SAMN05421642_112186 [Rhodococcus kyotonensis]
MSEGFLARSEQIAGLGLLAEQISIDTMASHRYISDHAGLSSNIPGQILQRLAPFIAHYQEYTRTRQVHLSTNCGYIGSELRKAAWLYDDQEKKNYDALNAHTELIPVPIPRAGTSETPAVGNVQVYGSAADYGSPSGIDYPPPNPAVDDTRETIDEAAGWLGEVDRTIFELTGWSPLNEATLPISGNWNEIRRLGEAFDIAGRAMEAAAESLENGVLRVDEYWDGRAAQAFSDYSKRQIAAMYWEGPCGRTIHALAEAITEQIRNGVRTVVRKLVEMLEAEVDLGSGRSAMKVALKKIPIVGTAWQIESIIEILWKTMDLTMDLVRKIEDVVDRFAQFLDAITDPEGQINQSIERHLEPFNDALDRGKVAVDTAKTADITPVIFTPDERFSVGEGTQPWQDA